jgi:hypothetical protein
VGQAILPKAILPGIGFLGGFPGSGAVYVFLTTGFFAASKSKDVGSPDTQYVRTTEGSSFSGTPLCSTHA